MRGFGRGLEPSVSSWHAILALLPPAARVRAIVAPAKATANQRAQVPSQILDRSNEKLLGPIGS
jgi:hypothetical protein